jgi:hypothetical protein
MKTIIIFLVLIPVLAAFSQEISASRNTMEINNTSSYIDSITFYNNGTNSLIVDSIQCEETNFLLSIGQFSDSANWVPIEEYFNATNVIEIQPNDSFQVRIGLLAIIAKIKQINSTQVDTIYFYNNSANTPIFPVLITQTMTKILESDKIKLNYILNQNYPNPLNPVTKIKYSVPHSTFISLKVYNLLGQEVAILVEEEKQVGTYTILFDGSGLASGVYYYRLETNDFTKTKKLLLLK